MTLVHLCRRSPLVANQPTSCTLLEVPTPSPEEQAPTPSPVEVTPAVTSEGMLAWVHVTKRFVALDSD